ncbi:hypothetical protein FA09DRAFT_84046 [Tilletiopsis washingtonensis]|uniref:Uncharacterized protein n=1 Tax=Tilletiopsis washingtonensis TaxID=58919 RepID=A0A316Z563_9BASI|nr:hypothetical protein FA09DRAFT_84046 [Tilletiopsis washingtonensis]PWN96739.1 hypothetical protein FA09DRAFT_84046 [Tilletiopsis washingtonensis]
MKGLSANLGGPCRAVQHATACAELQLAPLHLSLLLLPARDASMRLLQAALRAGRLLSVLGLASGVGAVRCGTARRTCSRALAAPVRAACSSEAHLSPCLSLRCRAHASRQLAAERHKAAARMPRVQVACTAHAGRMLRPCSAAPGERDLHAADRAQAAGACSAGALLCAEQGAAGEGVAREGFADAEGRKVHSNGVLAAGGAPLPPRRGRRWACAPCARTEAAPAPESSPSAQARPLPPRRLGTSTRNGPQRPRAAAAVAWKQRWMARWQRRAQRTKLVCDTQRSTRTARAERCLASRDAVRWRCSTRRVTVPEAAVLQRRRMRLSREATHTPHASTRAPRAHERCRSRVHRPLREGPARWSRREMLSVIDSERRDGEELPCGTRRGCSGAACLMRCRRAASRF